MPKEFQLISSCEVIFSSPHESTRNFRFQNPKTQEIYLVALIKLSIMAMPFFGTILFWELQVPCPAHQGLGAAPLSSADLDAAQQGQARHRLKRIGLDGVWLGGGRILLELFFPSFCISPRKIPRLDTLTQCGLSSHIHTFITCPHGIVSIRVAARVPQPHREASVRPLSADAKLSQKKCQLSSREMRAESELNMVHLCWRSYMYGHCPVATSKTAHQRAGDLLRWSRINGLSMIIPSDHQTISDHHSWNCS